MTGIELFGVSWGTPFQGLTVATIITGFLTAFGIWLKYGPERHRARNEEKVIDNADVALRFREWRAEVHAMRNELGKVQAELHLAQNESARRGDKVNMLRFILQMVLDELASKEPGNKVLAQAKQLLSRVEDEPHQLDNTDAMTAVEDAHDATGEAVRVLKAEEAKK